MLTKGHRRGWLPAVICITYLFANTEILDPGAHAMNSRGQLNDENNSGEEMR